MEVAAAAEVVDAHLRGTLSSVGFAAAAIGDDRDSAQVLYCADMRTVVRQVPGIPDGYDGQAPPGACFDVMVELQGDRVTDVNMDGGSLDAALDLFDMGDLAARIRGVLGSPAQVAAPVVAEGLKALFVDYPNRSTSEGAASDSRGAAATLPAEETGRPPTPFLTTSKGLATCTDSPPRVRHDVERLALAQARLFGTRRQAVTEGFRVEVEG